MQTYLYVHQMIWSLKVYFLLFFYRFFFKAYFLYSFSSTHHLFSCLFFYKCFSGVGMRFKSWTNKVFLEALLPMRVLLICSQPSRCFFSLHLSITLVIRGGTSDFASLNANTFVNIDTFYARVVWPSLLISSWDLVRGSFTNLILRVFLYELFFLNVNESLDVPPFLKAKP